MFKLKRPIVFLDLEATGVWPEKDRIVEIALIKLFPDGREELFHTRINPEMKIPPEATAIHRITDGDVKNAPPFREIAKKVIECFEGSDLGGFGLDRLDVPLLKKEFELAGVLFNFERCFLIDAKKVFMLKEPRDLDAACRRYLQKPLENAHSALADARASLEVFKAELEAYPDLPREVELLDEATQRETVYVDRTQRFRWWNGEVYFNFGKKGIYGKSLREVAKENPGYLQWMLDQNFPPEVLSIAADALNGKFPKPKKAT